MKRWSSLRRTDAPIPVALMASPPWDSWARLFRRLLGRRAAAHGPGAGGNRFDDVVIAGAAAQVALELLADGPLLERVALAVDDVDRGHDHAGGAEAALQAVVLAERLLHRVQLAVGREPLDGQHLGAVGLQREQRARLHGLAVDVDDAGAALRR